MPKTDVRVRKTSAKTKNGSKSKSKSTALVPVTSSIVPSEVLGRGDDGGSAVDQMLSGKVLSRTGKTARGKKKEKPVEKLPKELEELGDVLVAGRKIEREIHFKLQYAERKIKQYCQKRFAEHYAETGHRPESATYATAKSLFTFIQTRRTTLTPEKMEALKLREISLEGETELRGIKINFDAIREHKLEKKLRDALAQMGVAQKVLLECFHPDVQLKESFFEHLSSVVSKSLQEGEKLNAKIEETLQILDPASQIRNAELPNFNSVQSYKLVHEAEIEEVDELEALDD